MYGGPRRPPPTFFQGQFGPPRQNYRPQFANAGFAPSQRNFPPPFNNIYNLRNPAVSRSLPWSFGHPFLRGDRPAFQPRAWHAGGTRQDFRPSGCAEHRVSTIAISKATTSVYNCFEEVAIKYHNYSKAEIFMILSIKP